ncbi:A disintegrin and metalloproteinase with thrombospondin motifs 17 [Channa argus]|uniref:A disintegrin and metalloproteinase with thrombospondin motifs 17 n=1 Tax=Channa argus TaxID=215402 RepID=A0A6G1P9V5_CHAAH|nr:A disintegrin and metalloproteinase with thrombospondin motifs 17 [Channa argus]
MHHGQAAHLLLSLLCIVVPACAELETDEVVPRLLSGPEAHLSPQRTVHAERRRVLRSMDAQEEGHSYPDNLLLSLPAFGRNLYLNLTRDNTFLSRDFVVEERRRDRIAAVSRLPTSQLCFYTGSIVNRTDSVASISTCGGLFQASGNKYLGEVGPFPGNSYLVVQLSRKQADDTFDIVKRKAITCFCGYVTSRLGTLTLLNLGNWPEDITDLVTFGLTELHTFLAHFREIFKTGLVHIGKESLFIQPVGGNDPTQAFTRLKHRLLRYRRSARSSSFPHADQPNYCETVQGKKKAKRSKVGEEGRGKRNGIRLHSAYTVETVVVADSDMVQYHGAEAAQRFLLTVMNMVYNMFHHQSLGVRINIRVTKLVLLHSRPEKLKVGHYGERSLESFCQWQYQEFGGARYLGTNHVPGGKDDIPPVDTAVLVTRTDFCVHKDEPCDTVGIAYLGGVCSAKRKCVLAEDNGLNLAFTIAHELGHNMGMSHDDDHTTCTGHSHIMSGEWVKGRNPSDLSWSSCSRDDLENFLRSKASACLLHTDHRSRYQVRLPPKLPGMHYSVDEQCQILFGTNATFCNDMEREMYPARPNWILLWMEQSVVQTRTGECVSKTPIPQHVDGDWSQWSQWSMCSRTCGTGVQFRQRKCDNPPPGPGGRHCQKASVEHKACEGPPCPKGAPSFRDLQCLSYDRHASKKKGSMLTAVIDDEKPCVLFCSLVGQEAPVLMAERVMDGTPCGSYESDLCVNGKCQKIGCDGIIGSPAKEDRCGICNGDGRTCKIVRGDFNHTKGMGYIEAVVIPAGARRIKVVEDKPSHSFLALKDSSKKSINSDWKIELPGDFELAGTTVRYVRRGLWEKMSAKGPTKTPLHLMVLLFHDQSYGIHYEYTVSLNTTQDKTSEEQREPEYLYIWTHSSWQDCTVQCGGEGSKTLDPVFIGSDLREHNFLE